MKTAKTSASEGSPAIGRRAQPIRQTRANPPRTSSTHRAGPSTSGPPRGQPVALFPAVTHFADAITALPKDIVRHFTLLKEVDAKICGPEQELFLLIDQALDSGDTDRVRFTNRGAGNGRDAGGPAASNSDDGTLLNANLPSAAPNSDSANSTGLEPVDLHRRQKFRKSALKMQEILISLEEKNHVIWTANDALEKQLARITNIWPHLQDEFSDEAKWGSSTHWAYLENRAAKANTSQAERSRREGAATLSAAAQQLAEEAAARSSDRKKAIAEKKHPKNHVTETDGDNKVQDQGKKPQTNSKSRKPVVEAPVAVGLGISNGPTSTEPSSSKRRKADHKANGGQPMERASSAVVGNGGSKQKVSSPSNAPIPDGSSKKRKALPTSGNPSKKSRIGATRSPSVATSPVVGAFPEVAKLVRSSPAPSSNRPASSRVRQNSIQSNLDNNRPRPSSAAPGKPAGVSNQAVESEVGGNGTQVDAKTHKESVPASTTTSGQQEAETTQSEARQPECVDSPTMSKRKETVSQMPEDRDAQKEPVTSVAAPATATPSVTTKSGRASKPSTPAMATFAEAINVRPRPSRHIESTVPVVKRSHKKGGSIAAAVALAAQQTADTGEPRHNAPDEEDEAEIDGDEPRYCYCDGVSYGEMVACDAEACPREWFHLECVGLKVAPRGNAKWFCDDCKKRLRSTERKVNGR